MFNPLRAPCWRRKRFCEVLNFADDLPIPKLHDADSLKGRTLVLDDVLRHPEIVTSHNTANGEAARFPGMVLPQRIV